METVPHQFWEVLYFLGAAVVVSTVCNKLRITSTLGYLFAGVVLGPHFVGLFSNIEVSQHIAEFGVVFLLFTIGLELPWERLQELRRYVFGMGSVQVFLTSFLFGCMASYFGANLETAVLLGVGLAFSSTAVVLQLLSDQKAITSRFGRISFSVLLFQDFIVIVILVWVTLMQESKASFLEVLGWATFKVVGVFIGFVVFGRFLLRPFYRMVVSTKSGDLFFAMTLLIIVATSFATEYAGLSLGLGAFLAGLLMAETEYKHQVEADIKPFRSLLLGLFFMTVGMSLNPSVLLQDPKLIGSFFCLMLLGKIAVLLITCMIMRLPVKTGIRISLLLAGGSEFVFVLFKQAELSGLITNDLNQIVYLIVVLSMMVSPLLAFIGTFISNRIGRENGIALKAAEEESVDLKNHVIIVGFGLVGETVHNILATKYIPHIIVDMNISRVALGRMKNVPIFFGDARKIEVFHAFHAERAKAVVVSVDDFSLPSRLVITLKRYFPHLKVFVRVQDSDQAMKLQELGAEPVVPEMFAPSFQLASAVLELFGLKAEQVDAVIEKYRRMLLAKQNFKDGKVPWISRVFG